MNDDDRYKQFLDELAAFAMKHSVTRIKVSTENFDREFKLGQAGILLLVSTKAVIRVLGKVSKVPIGDDQEYKTFEEAETAMQKHWSEYYKNIRAGRSEAQIVAEKRRQKRYREKRKARDVELKRRQETEQRITVIKN